MNLKTIAPCPADSGQEVGGKEGRTIGRVGVSRMGGGGGLGIGEERLIFIKVFIIVICFFIFF